jgi:hypothetical protein
MENKLLNQKEVADYLNISESTLEQWRFKKMGPKYIKMGPRFCRYRLTDLEDFFKSRGSTAQKKD